MRRRWVEGAAEWFSGKYGSLQNLKKIFSYSDNEWQFIWSTISEDGTWDVPNIKDPSGIVLKENYAPEMMIKYIAHDL